MTTNNYVSVKIHPYIDLSVQRSHWVQFETELQQLVEFDDFIVTMHKYYINAEHSQRSLLESNAVEFTKHYNNSRNRSMFLNEHFEQCYCDNNQLWLRAYAAMVSELVSDEERWECSALI